MLSLLQLATRDWFSFLRKAGRELSELSVLLVHTGYGARGCEQLRPQHLHSFPWLRFASGAKIRRAVWGWRGMQLTQSQRGATRSVPEPCGHVWGDVAARCGPAKATDPQCDLSVIRAEGRSSPTVQGTPTGRGSISLGDGRRRAF